MKLKSLPYRNFHLEKMREISGNFDFPLKAMVKTKTKSSVASRLFYASRKSIFLPNPVNFHQFSLFFCFLKLSEVRMSPCQTVDLLSLFQISHQTPVSAYFHPSVYDVILTCYIIAILFRGSF